jgi:predicted ester cyclase
MFRDGRDRRLDGATTDRHRRTPWTPTPQMSGSGPEGLAAFWDSTMGPLPDCRVENSLLVADGEVVVEEGTVSGTNTEPSPALDGSLIPPTGRPISFGFVAVHHVRDGRITASRFSWDGMAVVAQMGLLPEPAG